MAEAQVCTDDNIEWRKGSTFSASLAEICHQCEGPDDHEHNICRLLQGPTCHAILG